MAKLEKSGIKRLAEIYIWLLLQAVLLFAAAGRFDLPRAWVYFGSLLAYCVLSQAVMFLFFRERILEIANERGAKHEGTKGWDKSLSAVIAFCMMITPVVAGLDAGRFGWSSLGRGFVIPGLIVTVLGNVLSQWALLNNKHFEKTVRIQFDREHRVVSTGPYGIIRHPGYLGMIGTSIAFPFIIGSALALIPAGITALAMVIRTALEDRTLRRELEGYLDYSRKTKYRLIPGIW